MTARILLPAVLTICMASTSVADTRSPEGGEYGGSLTLIPLKRSVSELVERHYPGATSHTFGDRVHFEHLTRVYVSEEIVKVPKGRRAPLGEVRGPMKGGVWCMMEYVEGSLKDSPASARADGGIERRGFTEHFFRQDYPTQDHGAPACHLVVTLRLPSGAGEKEKEFFDDLRGFLKSYVWQGPQTAASNPEGEIDDPSAGGPLLPDTRKAALDALKAIERDALKHLKVHPPRDQ